MRRRAFLLLPLAAALGGAAEPAPFAPVRRLYQSLPRPVPAGTLSRRLRALVRADEAAERRRLDFEWRAGGDTRPDISDLRLRLVRARGAAAVVEASFYNGGARRFRRFFLVLEDRRWVVDDALLVPENLRLADLLGPERRRGSAR